MILENKKDLSGTAGRTKENSKDRGTASSSTEQKNANQHQLPQQFSLSKQIVFKISFLRVFSQSENSSYSILVISTPTLLTN
jgi:hypothetical protein